MIAAFLAATAAFLEVGDDGCEDRRRGSRRPARRSRRTHCRRTSARCLGHKYCKRGAVLVQGSRLAQEKGVQSTRVEAGEEVAIVEVPQAHFEAALEELAVEGSQQGKEAAPGVAAEPRLEVQVLHVARSAAADDVSDVSFVAQAREAVQHYVEEARRSSDAEVQAVQGTRIEAGEEVVFVEEPQAHLEAALVERAVGGSQQGMEATPGVAAEPRLEVQALHVARSAVPAQPQEKVEEARRSSDAEECLGLGAAEVLMWAGIEDAAALCVQVHTCAAKGDFDSAKLLAVIDEHIELLRAGTGRQALAALAWPCHKPRSCSWWAEACWACCPPAASCRARPCAGGGRGR